MIKKPRREDRKNSPFEDRKKFCPFSQKNSPKIDYKDVKMLQRYISEKGKITPSRITNVSSKKQKELAKKYAYASKDVVKNRLSTLRKRYGEHVIPKAKHRPRYLSHLGYEATVDMSGLPEQLIIDR